LPDPVTTAIATAVAGSAAQSLTEQTARLLAQIAGRIHRKLSGQSPEPAARPGTDGSPERAAALAALLHRAFQDDPAFAAELTTLWQGYLSAAAGTSTNTFHGNADKVVQLRDVHGDLTIG
jgi:Ser/Thr protein kinase RdoA (MazF antagonist)